MILEVCGSFEVTLRNRLLIAAEMDCRFDEADARVIAIPSLQAPLIFFKGRQAKIHLNYCSEAHFLTTQGSMSQHFSYCSLQRTEFRY